MGQEVVTTPTSFFIYSSKNEKLKNIKQYNKEVHEAIVSTIVSTDSYWCKKRVTTALKKKRKKKRSIASEMQKNFKVD